MTPFDPEAFARECERLAEKFQTTEILSIRKRLGQSDFDTVARSLHAASRVKVENVARAIRRSSLFGRSLSDETITDLATAIVNFIHEEG